jgi:hypothetical protein
MLRWVAECDGVEHLFEGQSGSLRAGRGVQAEAGQFLLENQNGPGAAHQCQIKSQQNAHPEVNLEEHSAQAEALRVMHEYVYERQHFFVPSK